MYQLALVVSMLFSSADHLENVNRNYENFYGQGRAMYVHALGGVFVMPLDYAVDFSHSGNGELLFVSQHGRIVIGRETDSLDAFYEKKLAQARDVAEGCELKVFKDPDQNNNLALIFNDHGYLLVVDDRSGLEDVISTIYCRAAL